MGEENFEDLGYLAGLDFTFKIIDAIDELIKSDKSGGYSAPMPLLLLIATAYSYILADRIAFVNLGAEARTEFAKGLQGSLMLNINKHVFSEQMEFDRLYDMFLKYVQDLGPFSRRVAPDSGEEERGTLVFETALLVLSKNETQSGKLSDVMRILIALSKAIYGNAVVNRLKNT